jgi:hypothetical protein
VFVLSCVGSGLEIEVVIVQRVLPTVCKIHTSRLILMRNRPESLIRMEAYKKKKIPNSVDVQQMMLLLTADAPLRQQIPCIILWSTHSHTALAKYSE